MGDLSKKGRKGYTVMGDLPKWKKNGKGLIVIGDLPKWKNKVSQG
jgi:hypothetical protein